MQNPDTEKTIRQIGKNQSLYDKDRETVGAIYQKAQQEGEKIVVIGDMAHELAKSLVEDINDALNAPRPNNKPFYLMVHEKKDLQMKSAILRRMIYFGYRPWPEDDTVVFWKNPKTQELRFCWALPHHSEMDNILANPDHFEKEFVAQIKAWKAFDMHAFGFYYDKELEWIPNPRWKDKRIESASPKE